MTMANRFRYEDMNRTTALEIIHWRYEPPHDFYNLYDQGPEEVVMGFLNPEYHYFSVWDRQDHLIGYRCFGEDARVPGGDYGADALDMGGGLQPSLTGQGMGAAFLRSAIDFAQARFAPKAFRATVAAFNRRALRVCEKVGYCEIQRFYSTPNNLEFVLLWRDIG